MKEYSDLEDCDLYRHIYDATSQIPRGMVSTYGDIAEALGDKAASRAVGTTLSSNPRPIVVPCHRVVYRDGRVGWYNGLGKGNDIKSRLLREEGLDIVDGVVQNLEAVRFDRFDLRPVLREMREMQSLSAAEVITKDDFDPVERIVGLDVSYDGDDAYAAAVTLDVKSGDIFRPGYPGRRSRSPTSRATSVSERCPRSSSCWIKRKGCHRPRRRPGKTSPTEVRHRLPSGRKDGNADSWCGEIHSDRACTRERRHPTRRGAAGKGRRGGTRKYYVSVGHRVSLGTAESMVITYLSNTSTDVLRMAHIAATEARKVFEMKIAIIGAGAVGSVIGGMLSRHHDVTLVGRPDHVKAIKKNGLTIEGEGIFSVHAERHDLSADPRHRDHHGEGA